LNFAWAAAVVPRTSWCWIERAVRWDDAAGIIPRMDRLVKACAAVILSSLCMFAAIRPLFYLESCVWNTTEILVLAPTGHAGSFKVVETINGDPQPGATLELDGLRPTSGAAGRLKELIATYRHPHFRSAVLVPGYSASGGRCSSDGVLAAARRTAGVVTE
jgi:hypothetical protein